MAHFWIGCLNLAELMFLETSALTGENVEEAFLKCARTILNKIESGASLVLLATGLALGVVWVL